VRALTTEYERAQQLLNVTTAEIQRLSAERGEIQRAHSEAEAELLELAERKTAIENGIESHLRSSEELTAEIESMRRDFAGLQSQLAVLQERSSTVKREIESLTQQALE